MNSKEEYWAEVLQKLGKKYHDYVRYHVDAGHTVDWYTEAQLEYVLHAWGVEEKPPKRGKKLVVCAPGTGVYYDIRLSPVKSSSDGKSKMYISVRVPGDEIGDTRAF